MKGSNIIIISILGFITISPTQGDVEIPLGQLYEKTQQTLERVSVKLTDVSGGDINSNITDFIDNMTKDLNRMQNTINQPNVPKLNMLRVGELLKNAVREFERNKGNKNKRVLKDIVETTKANIGVLGPALKEFIEALKPVGGEVLTMAAEIQKSIGAAADKLLNAVTAASEAGQL